MRMRWSKLLVLLSLLTVGYAFWINNPAQSQQGVERQQLNQLLGQAEPLPQQEQPMPFSSSPPGGPSASGGSRNPFFEDFFKQQGLPMPESFSAIASKMSDSFEKLQQGINEAGPVTVTEKPDEYVLTVAVNNKDDAHKVVVTVTPHQIAVSGSFSNGETGSQSFMKSFTTDATLDAHHVTRELNHHDRQLVIRIPKTTSGEKSTSQPVAPAHPENLQSDGNNSVI